MKKYTLLLVFFCLSMIARGQFAEPAVTGANFVPNTVAMNDEAILAISFANTGSTAIPTGSIELTISTASIYYVTDGVSQPTGTGSSLFTWTYLGSDTWRGINKVPVTAFDGGLINLKVNGIKESASFETTNINVQPVSNFTSFSDSPNNNNLQPKLKVIASTSGDSDGDGDPDNTDPNPTDPCIYGAGQVYANATVAFKGADCDGDGVPNGKEIDPDGNGTPGGTGPNGPATDPLSACSLNLGDVTLTATSTGDCDGDGVTNANEINSSGPTDPRTSPIDPCAYNTAEQVFASTTAAWKALDCDGDGNPNGTDPNPKVPTAVNDVLAAPQGSASTVNVLTNDDFLPGAGTSLTVISGGTATGTASFDPLTGILSYLPAPGESGLVTLKYRVCNTVPTPDVCAEATVSITISSLSAKLNLKVLLQGALLPTSSSGGPIMNGIMRDDLRTASPSQIPNLEPYAALANARFTHVGGGGETIGAGVLSAGGNDAIVDWVFVELRDKNNPATVLKTRSALVQRDGDVVESTDGISPLTFTGAVGESYYVSVKHRNHLGAMTSGAIAMNAVGTLVDFTTMTAAQTYNLPGYDGFEQVDVNGKMALWAGNSNADNKVKYVGVDNDQIPVFSQAVNYVNNTTQQYNYDFATPVYLGGDINMDAKVKYRGPNNDASFIFFNVITKYAGLNTGALYNYDLFIEQLP